MGDPKTSAGAPGAGSAHAAASQQAPTGEGSAPTAPPAGAFWRIVAALGALKDALAVLGALFGAGWLLVQIGCPTLPAAWQPFVPKMVVGSAVAKPLASGRECLVRVEVLIENVGTRTFELAGYKMSARHFAVGRNAPLVRPAIWGGVSRWEQPAWPPAGSNTLIADDLLDRQPVCSPHDPDLPREYERKWIRAKSTERVSRDLRVPVEAGQDGYVIVTFRGYFADSDAIASLHELSCEGAEKECTETANCGPRKECSEASIQLCARWPENADTARPGARFGVAGACVPWPSQKSNAEENRAGVQDVEVVLLVPQCELLGAGTTPRERDLGSERSATNGGSNASHGQDRSAPRGRRGRNRRLPVRQEAQPGTGKRYGWRQVDSAGRSRGPETCDRARRRR